MANTNAPFGFRQYGGTGSVPTYEQVAVRVAHNASAIFYGDPVLPDANGFVVVGAPGTTQVAGIFQGCKYLSVSQKRTVWSNYWPGTDVASNQIVEGYIVNDPNAKFVVQTDATGIDATAINANVNFSIGTGNTATGISGAFLNTSTLGATNTLPFRVVGLVQDPPGAPGTAAGAYNLAVVAFNNVSTKQLTGI
jgi:hypothetical protein